MNANQKGMSLIEVLVSLTLVVVALFTMLRFTSSAYRTSRHTMDRQFATQKAISMLEELRALVQIQNNSATVLDSFDDGTTLNPILTTDDSVTDPAASLSNNVRVSGSTWHYVRQVSVSLLPGTSDANVRLVNVRVYDNKDANNDGNKDTLAEVAGVIRTAAGNFPTTQVYDVYALAIENVPGWWVYMANLIPFVQTAVQNVQARNPGLELRVHWITELSYGRDQQYRPQINSSVDSLASIENVYFYPGKMPSTEAVSYYYPPNNFNGHVLVDSTNTNDYNASTNPNNYALADMYNHAMRYPDELALFNARVTSGQETADSPTLRLLLERLYQNPDQYRNAIFINLHGELFPFPPVRNYSDPAKEPTASTGFPGIRVVTHPERIHYNASATSVKLRVYSYRTDPTASGSTNIDWLGQGPNLAPIVIKLKGINWTPTSGSADIQKIYGGTDQDGTAGADAYGIGNATTCTTGNQMCFTVTAGTDTIIKLYNSPLKAPEVTAAGTTKGLHSSERLYGLEYLPAPSEDLTPTGTPTAAFTSNLATATHGVASSVCANTSPSALTTDNCTPNTARWIITIPASFLPGGTGGSGLVTVETRIDSEDSGTRTNEPPNLSKTYIWRGTDNWVFGDGTTANLPHMPITEQYQFMGDPRHNPYADLKSPHSSSGRPLADTLGMGYNRYFDDFENTSSYAGGLWWKGYNYTISGQSYGIKNDGTADNDGFTEPAEYNELDMNRVYQVLRNVLAESRVVWTTMTGYSYYYCGIGGEIGYDSANDFPNSIPVNTKLFTGTSGNGYEQSILPEGTNGGIKYIKENVSGNYWWGLNWLGELYPDSQYSTWTSTGNLPTGSGANHFVRTLRSAITQSPPALPYGTTFVNAGRRTGPEGSTAFYWNGAVDATFHHVSSDGTGDLESGGTEVAGRYNFPVSNGIDINRPFYLDRNETSKNPDHYLQAPYGPVFTAAIQSPFYDHSVQTSGEGSALLSLAGSGNDIMFVVVNGISMTGQSGTSFIANWSLLTLIQAFLQAGRYSAVGNATHVDQVPRITITSPNATTNLSNPSSVSVGWTRAWVRWDGQSYTGAYPSGYAETSALSYTVMYSADNGSTWKYMQNNTAATPGVRPSSSAVLISSASATPSYTWSTPSSSFPRGTYLIRVESYRDNFPLHYAYHQYRMFIRR